MSVLGVAFRGQKEASNEFSSLFSWICSGIDHSNVDE
jgi:hypothetical protein